MVPGSTRNWIGVNAVQQSSLNKKTNMTILRLIKSIGRSPSRLALLLILLVFGCFALSQSAQGVVPAPDGGYPGQNTAEGQNALKNLTTGSGNTAVGWFSLKSLATGSFNTGVGAGTLALNTADNNTATGAAALFLNTTGDGNTANGVAALLSNSTGAANTANGVQALFSNTAGSNNTANGNQALLRNTTGSQNRALGDSALLYNTTGAANTAIGEGAVVFSSTGNNNTALGFNAGSNVGAASNVICIGAGVGGADVSNTCYIGNIFGVTSTGGAGVFVNGDGKLGTATSSQRFKQEIKPMGNASDALFALKPVAFRYKKDIDPKGTPQLGLVAEDVEKVNPDLVVRDKEGKPYSVRYDQVNAMLLNEFLKAHQRIEEQGERIDQLTAQLKQQAAQIQKVSAQLEASKPAPQLVNNP
jgi:hypothetical protein